MTEDEFRAIVERLTAQAKRVAGAVTEDEYRDFAFQLAWLADAGHAEAEATAFAILALHEAQLEAEGLLPPKKCDS